MEIYQFKNKKISEITQTYNSQINNEKVNYQRNIRNIKNNFMLSKFQKEMITRSLDNQLSSKIKSIEQKMNEIINNIRNSQNNKLNNGNKKALLIGINYDNTTAQLNGCINDVSLISSFINDKGFSSITIITDKTDKKPTKLNILSELEKLFNESDENDILYFHYSGHGSYISDKNNDELDQKDETIVSKDLQHISDDEIISLIKRKLPKNRTLIAVFDSCHSGTILDLKYSFVNDENFNKLEIIENNKYEDINPNIILISGCKDNQYSQECMTPIGINGLLTWAIYTFLNNNKDKKVSWRTLYTSIGKMLKNIGAIQIPQLSIGSLIDINELAIF
jgi:hypothetical protein